MKATNPTKLSAGIAFASMALLLTACGGGGDSGSSTPPSKPILSEKPINISPTTNVTVNEKKESINSNPIVEQPTAPVGSKFRDLVREDAHINLTVLNELNRRRMSCGFPALERSAELDKAATNHADYLIYMEKYSNQGFQGHHEYKVGKYSGINNPYYSGWGISNRLKTGNDIGTKAQPVSYNSGVDKYIDGNKITSYYAIGENLSYSSANHAYVTNRSDFEIAQDALIGLLAAPYHMAGLMNPNYTEVGIEYHRDKIRNIYPDGTYGMVLELVSARPNNKAAKTPKQDVLTYPCDGSDRTAYKLDNEYPNPIPSRNLKKNPIGQPIYIRSGNGKPIHVRNYSMKSADGEKIELLPLTKANDPNKKLREYEVILMPSKELKPNTGYTVNYGISINNGSYQTKYINFTTQK